MIAFRAYLISGLSNSSTLLFVKPVSIRQTVFSLNILLIIGEYNGKRKQRIKEASMSKMKDNLIEITINLVVALAVISTLVKGSL